MTRSIHVRLDDEAVEALSLLRRSAGLDTDSKAVRQALRESAHQRRRRGALRSEAEELARDAADRSESRKVRTLMDSLVPADE